MQGTGVGWDRAIDFVLPYVTLDVNIRRSDNAG